MTVLWSNVISDNDTRERTCVRNIATTPPRLRNNTPLTNNKSSKHKHAHLLCEAESYPVYSYACYRHVPKPKKTETLKSRVKKTTLKRSAGKKFHKPSTQT